MGKTYYLDLKTLIETLAGQTGVLQRELPKGFGPLNEPCLCTISLSNGQIIQCNLSGSSGRQIDAFPLLPSLYTLETWEVILTQGAKHQTSPRLSAQSPQTVLPMPTPPSVPILFPNDLLIPYPIVPLNTMLPTALQHKDSLLIRIVQAQIDGQRNIAEIRSRLPLSADLIYHILDVLFQNGFIRFRKGDGPL